MLGNKILEYEEACSRNIFHFYKNFLKPLEYLVIYKFSALIKQFQNNFQKCLSHNLVLEKQDKC